ncbi:MAG: cobalamin-binding protein [Motiliproteus sp.]
MSFLFTVAAKVPGRIACWAGLWLAISSSYCVAAPITVVDDADRTVTLSGPAQRIVSLAPHVTEMLFSAGAGDRVVGVVSYSDFPPEATRLPLVGSYDRLDLERILSLKPDLIVGWRSGNPQPALEQLQQLSVPLYLSEPLNFDDIPRSLERFGQLAGSQRQANTAAREYQTQLDQLTERYRTQTRVSVFYQVWREPLMTFNGEHLFNDVLRLCGGHNPFSDLPRLASSIELEAVLKADPQVIVVGETNRQWIEDWRRWPTLTAVKNDRLYALNQDVLVRPTTRIIEGIRQVCAVLQPQR